MRVVSGLHRGRQLKSVPGKIARPTTDKVKEAIFQVLGPYFRQGACLDLFAGSGALGIEALSRGMEKAIFVDKHPKAIHTINENIRMLQLENNVEIFKSDAFNALNGAAKRGLQFDLILLDPPYYKVNYAKLLGKVTELDLLHDDGMIFCEHDATEDMAMTDERYEVLKRKLYGETTGITIYKKKRE
ncbi:16S rRNA (guanine(966)-N(2))-methyltransferase RsmD [Lentibacillus cibarius]|uniref:16S rRNA (Guanine(966)-N(2))-methyltransferase RsmD n=1 Tax=Lentibacillus cibarius TaxID=2583219 RepID=A0A549YK81_9BACI|nr:16S rRNA (guanine(966)-N(2))-methyltransferase RsmD [Lentibacillus cibarius]TMN23476.1 16S rRNA (guanine(966)-N(2))-methyltransferase RsmD [Lentibacillus cibarius]TRM12292.1 16S rRNA (guanine(966)-N(2))-methyltransferase RsmD [Lentibacillus cibarius]